MTFLVMPLGKQPYKPPFHMDTNSILGTCVDSVVLYVKQSFVVMFVVNPKRDGGFVYC